MTMAHKLCVEEFEVFAERAAKNFAATVTVELLNKVAGTGSTLGHQLLATDIFRHQMRELYTHRLILDRLIQTHNHLVKEHLDFKEDFRESLNLLLEAELIKRRSTS